MTKPSYENQIFNVQLIEGWGEGFDSIEKLTYKTGCRDTRHQASEIAMNADNEIKNLKRLLQASVYFVRESGMFDHLVTEIEEVLNDK